MTGVTFVVISWKSEKYAIHKFQREYPLVVLVKVGWKHG